MSTASASHLSEKARADLLLSDEDRIAVIRRGGWIALKPSKSFLAELEALLAIGPQTRPRNLLLIGDSNSGKSTIFERFVSLHQMDLDPEAEVTEAPVVCIDCPDGPDRDALCIWLLEAIFARYKPQDKYEAKLAQVVRLYKQLGVRVILIDEIHHALQGTIKQQALFLNCLKRISNLTKCHFAAAGTEKATMLLGVDEQMTSRFKSFRMPEWNPGKDLGELLDTLENRLPLRNPSNLKSTVMMKAINSRAEGSLGDTIDLVRECAVAAIRSTGAKECITVTLVKSLEWIAPSKRRDFGKIHQPPKATPADA